MTIGGHLADFSRTSACWCDARCKPWTGRGRVRPALARANTISDEIGERDDPCPFWDAAGLNACSLVVEAICASLELHDRIDWLAGG